MNTSKEHYVFLVLPKEKVTREVKDNIIELAERAKNKLKFLTDYSITFTDNAQMQTVGVVVQLRFPNQALLDAYLVHPLHLKLLGSIKSMILHKDAFDWESA